MAYKNHRKQHAHVRELHRLHKPKSLIVPGTPEDLYIKDFTPHPSIFKKILNYVFK